MTSALIVKDIILVGVNEVRLKLFRLKAEGGRKAHLQNFAECDSCIKHDFKMRFFLTVFNLQPVHLCI